MVAALVVGLTLALWQMVRAVAAEREQSRLRQEAQVEAAKSRQVARFLKDMLEGVGPSVAKGRDTTMLREILDKTAERIGKDLAKEPEVEFELREVLRPIYDELGLVERAEEMASINLQLARGTLRDHPKYVAEAVHQYGGTLIEVGKLRDAENQLLEALALKKKFFGSLNVRGIYVLLLLRPWGITRISLPGRIVKSLLRGVAPQ